MKNLEIQKWQCQTTGDSELQHFLHPRCTYVFGFNKKLLGAKCYKKVLAVIQQSLGGRKGAQRKA
jgi:hypothetical protein